MQPGDLVRNKNSESGELGLFMGIRAFKHNSPSNPGAEDYVCGEVYWYERAGKYSVGTIQLNLIEVIDESK